MHNILGHELIGIPINILDAKNRQLVGMTGIVVDETKNTFVLDVNGKKKRVMKKDITLKVGKYIIQGKLLVARPEERLKVKR
ncbi:ribonuclease P protein subunit [Candidatus Woesearchaeota archaeon]|nr:ribonuclease P protein subunit [Candidatus Woesearchaeota archaeon]